jgi:hypothetical protein
MTPTDEIWRRIVPPLVAGFAAFLAMLRYAYRHPSDPKVLRTEDRRPGFGRYLVRTVASGYLAMLAIVLVFHVVLARDHAALRSAAAGGAALLGIAVPVFVLARWIERRIGP